MREAKRNGSQRSGEDGCDDWVCGGGDDPVDSVESVNVVVMAVNTVVVVEGMLWWWGLEW